MEHGRSALRRNGLAKRLRTNKRNRKQHPRPNSQRQSTTRRPKRYTRTSKISKLQHIGLTISRHTTKPNNNHNHKTTTHTYHNLHNKHNQQRTKHRNQHTNKRPTTNQPNKHHQSTQQQETTP